MAFFHFYYRVASGAGLRRPSVRPSHIQFTMWLPMALRTSVSSRGKSSRSSERTRDTWVPRFLWIPEHSMHISAPRFRLAHVGSGEKQIGVTTLGITALILWFVPPAGNQFAKRKIKIMEVTIGKWQYQLYLEMASCFILGNISYMCNGINTHFSEWSSYKIQWENQPNVCSKRLLEKLKHFKIQNC